MDRVRIPGSPIGSSDPNYPSYPALIPAALYWDAAGQYFYADKDGQGAAKSWFKPSNTAQDATVMQAAVTAAAGAGDACVMPGTAAIATAVQLPSASRTVCSPGTYIKQTFATHVNLDATYTTRGTERTPANTGTLASTPTRLSKTLSCTLSSTPLVGGYLKVQLAANNTSQAIYQIVAVVGSSSPYTVTTDRAIVWPFVSGDALTELTGVVERAIVEGGGQTMSGPGNQAVQFTLCRQCIVRDTHYVYDAAAGVCTGSPFGYDVACRECVLEDWSADNRNNSAGFYFQSNECSQIRRGVVRNAGSSVGVFDSYMCSVVDVWGYDLTRNAAAPDTGGIFLGRIAPGSTGCFDCTVKGGGHINIAGTGVYVETALRSLVEDHHVDGCTNGFKIDSGAVGTRLIGISARNASASGLDLLSGATGTHVTGYVTAGCDYGIRVRAGTVKTVLENIRIESFITYGLHVSDNCQIRGLDLTASSTDSASPILVAAGVVTIEHGNWASTKANASVIQVSGGTVTLKDILVGVATGANQTAFYLTGGTVYLDGCIATETAAASNSFGIYVGGATVTIGPNCDMSNTDAPLTIASGTCYMVPQAGLGAITVTGANVTATWAQFRPSTIRVSGAVTGSRRDVIMPHIVGHVWRFKVDTTGALGIRVIGSTGAGVNFADGSTGSVMFDGTNFVTVT